MNTFALVILAALLLDYLLNLTADYLNLKSLDEPLPDEFRDTVDEETYKKSQAYTRARTRFGIISSSVDLPVLLIFWFAGGFNWLDQLVRSWGFGVVETGLFYIGALVLFRMLLSLPFNIYSTFVIEEEFGFNRTTPKTFVADLLKGVLLSVVLGAPVLAGIIAFFEFGGALAWLWAWLAVTLFTLLVQFIAPTWIMPIFNTFEPLDDEELRRKFRDYAAKVRFPLKGIYVMDGSKRSSKSNAFFTGFGENKRIALFDTLLKNHSHEELMAVLAHEIGHYKKRHIPRNILLSVIQSGIMFLLLSLFLQVPGLFEAFYMDQMSVYAGLVFFGLLYAPVQMVLSLGMQALSRRFEYEADEFAAETTNNPDAMIQVLKKLSRDNLSHLTPHRFYVMLHYSHPTVLQRIRALRRVGTRSGSGLRA